MDDKLKKIKYFDEEKFNSSLNQSIDSVNQESDDSVFGGTYSKEVQQMLSPLDASLLDLGGVSDPSTGAISKRPTAPPPENVPPKAKPPLYSPSAALDYMQVDVVYIPHRGKTLEDLCLRFTAMKVKKQDSPALIAKTLLAQAGLHYKINLSYSVADARYESKKKA